MTNLLLLNKILRNWHKFLYLRGNKTPVSAFAEKFTRSFCFALPLPVAPTPEVVIL